MPRTPRLHLPGALYYVTSRGIPGQSVFRDARDYATYLELLATYKVSHHCAVYAYALLPDELHLCLEVRGAATISDIMHDLNSRYTKLVNKRYQRTGHVFQSRYRAVVVEKEPYLLRLTRYIHAQDVSGQGATSLPDYLGHGSQLVDTADVLAHFPGGDPHGVYAQFMQAGGPEELEQLGHALQRSFVGSAMFVAQLAAQAKASRSATTVAAAAAPAVPALPVMEEEPAAASGAEAMAVPARRGASMRVALTLAATLSVLVTVMSATYLAGKAMTLAGKRVEVVVHQSSLPGGSSATRAVEALPTSVSRNTFELNGTSWEVQLTPANGQQGPAQQRDLIQFADGQIKSWGLSAQGFPMSNYTLTLQPEGTLVWETMQTGPDGAIASWRGEWDGQVMRGILIRQGTGGQAEEFTFTGTYHGTGADHARQNI